MPPEPDPPTHPNRLPALALAALVVVLVAALLVVRPWQGDRTASTGWTPARPTSTVDAAGAASPADPGEQPWAGTAPLTGDPMTGGPLGGGAMTGPAGGASPGRSADAFCTTARSEAASLGSGALETLKSLATRAGDASPRARALVQGTASAAARLRDAAPDAVRSAASTLASAWSGLARDLDRSGYDRATMISLALTHLGHPTVAAAWQVVARWATDHCGLDLLHAGPPA